MPGLDAAAVAPGTASPMLTAAITCPICGGVMEWTNGRTARTGKGVGTECLALLRCQRHGTWEVRMTLRRADVAPTKVPGVEQRRRARERAAMAGVVL